MTMSPCAFAAAMLRCLWLLALGLAAAWPSRAGAACPAPLPVAVEIIPRIDPVAYDFTRSRAEIRQIAAQGHANIAGLTTSRIEVSWNVGLTVHSRGRETCVAANSVVVELGLAASTIYVAREFAAGTCDYARVLAHEHEHQSINEAALAALAERLERDLGPTADRIGWLAVADAATGKAAIFDRLQRVIDDAFNGANGAADQRHQQIDALPLGTPNVAECR